MKKALCTAVCMLLMSLSVIAEGLLPYYAVTNRSNVNMRSKPDSKSRLVMQIKTKGTKLTVLSGQPDGQGNEWLEVETQRGRKGYIQSKYITKTEGRPIVRTNGKYGSWSDAYCDFVLGEKYKMWRGQGPNDQIFDEDEYGLQPVLFSMFDMDQNGIPELLIGGNGSMAGNCFHVFTFVDGLVKFCGNAGFMDSELWAIPNIEYPGLFCYSGKDRWYATYYYWLNNGMIQEQQVSECQYEFVVDEQGNVTGATGDIFRMTNDALLYNAALQHEVCMLKRYQKREIEKLGWDSFLLSPCYEPRYMETWISPDTMYERYFK